MPITRIIQLLYTLSLVLPLSAHAANIEIINSASNDPSTSDTHALKLDELHLEAKGEPIALPGKRSVQRMIQTYRGIPIYGHSVALERDAQAKVLQASGRYLNGIEQDLHEVKPRLSPDQAVQALQEQWRIKKTVTSQAPTSTSAKLFVYLPSNETRARLIYRVAYGIDNKTGLPSNPTGLIDAFTGEVLKLWEGVASVSPLPAQGPGGNELTGKYHYGKKNRPPLPAAQRGPSCSFDNKGIQVFYGDNSVPKSVPWMFKCPVSVQTTINGGYAPINDLYFHSLVTRDLYLDILGVEPAISGFKVVFLSAPADGAGWDTVNNIGFFLSGATFFHPIVSQDVVAHEISHAFSDQNSGLDPSSTQGGGINEAFSDMAGEAAKYRRDGKSDFIVLSEITKPDGDYGHLGGLRQMCNQSTDGHSIEHASLFEASDKDPHYTSGVYNKAFCLLAKTPGWNQRQAFQVFALANHSFWSQEETFDSAACGVEKAALALGHPVADLQKALTEVGVRCGNL